MKRQIKIGRLHHFLILATVVFALYANILPNSFVWDDNIFILQNEFIRHWRNVPLLFRSHFFERSLKEAIFTKEGGYYRPVVMVLYTLEYHLWGEKALYYHLVSIFLHLLNVFLVYRLFQKLFQNEKISFLGALLFAAHPVHTEAVSYLPSRGDLLAGFFCLSSLLLFRSPKRFQRLLSLFLFGFALLSKESAVILPALLWVLAFSDPHKKKGEEWAASAPYGGLFFLYIAVRFFFLPFRMNPQLQGDPGLFLRTVSSGRLILSYLALLLFPYPLHLERTVSFQPKFWDVGTAQWILVASAVFILGKIFWRRNRPLLFGISWFVISLAPVANVVPIYPPMAEHYLYFPCIGFFIVIAFGLYRFFAGVQKKRDRGVLLVLGGLMVCFWGIVIIQRNQDYSSDIRLFTHTAIQSPKSPGIHNNLGTVYMVRGLMEEAGREFERSLALNPDQAIVWANLGTVYRQKKEYEKAIQCFKQALERNLNDAVIWNKLGIAYAESENEGAEAAFREAIRKDAAFLDPYFNLGSYYWGRGDFKKAAFYWEEGLRRDPDQPLFKTWLPLARKRLSKGTE